MRENTGRRKRSVPEIARQLGVGQRKVIAWIKSGELVAIDLVERRGGRPRYAVDVADLAKFEASRRVISTVKNRTRRIRRTVKEFF